MYTLFVARGYPTEKYKTYGIFEFDQAKALAKKGVKVVYAAIDLRSIRRWRKWGIQKTEKDGVIIYSINIPLGRVPAGMLRKFGVSGLKRLYKKIEKEQGRPDVIHAHFTNSAYSASFLKEEVGIPLVVTEHSSKINKDNIDEDLKKVASRAYKRADSLVAVSDALAKKMEKNFGVTAKYIPNIVDLDEFEYKEKPEADKFTIISTGNLREIKRMDLLIRAFSKAFAGDENINLKIFGQGEEKSNLESLIREEDLESQVELMGLRPRREIAQTLSDSDLFVLASKAETFGVAFIEALAMGVPVISTRSGGPEGFINSENGLLVDDEESLVDGMEYMYKNIGEYHRKNIARETKELFSGDKFVEEIMTVYKELLEK